MLNTAGSVLMEFKSDACNASTEAADEASSAFGA